MLTITGTLAVALILLVGPYRTLQRRWRGLAPPFLPVWVHSNLASAALVIVVLHLVGVGAPGLSVAWLGAALFVVAFGSGLYGLYLAARPSRRRSWVRFHRRLNWVFYGAIVPHILTEGLGVPLLVIAVAGVAFWQRRGEANAYLVRRLNWPFHRARRGAPQGPR
jgi:hypothetical protein